MKKYTIFGKEIGGPFTIPAGIVTTEIATISKISNEILEIGIITTKIIGPEPSVALVQPQKVIEVALMEPF